MSYPKTRECTNFKIRENSVEVHCRHTWESTNQSGDQCPVCGCKYDDFEYNRLLQLKQLIRLNEYGDTRPSSLTRKGEFPGMVQGG